MSRLLNGPNWLCRLATQAGKKVNASVCGTANSIMSWLDVLCARSMARVFCKACKTSSDWSYSVLPAAVRRVG